MAMKGYSEFPKALVSLEPHHRIVYCHIQETRWGSLIVSAEMQSMGQEDLEEIAMKGYPKVFVLLDLPYQIV